MTVTLNAANLPALARGCAILGGGGGGDPYIDLLVALEAVGDCGPVTLVEAADLMRADLMRAGPERELPDGGLVMPCGMIGAPTIAMEKLGCGDEGARLRAAVEREHGRPVVALMPYEIGGVNGLIPVAWAARLGLPLVDADGMGRAFPEILQVTMELAGIPPGPCVITDERGSTVVVRAPAPPLPGVAPGRWVERLARTITVEFGGQAMLTHYQMTPEQAARATVRGSVSAALALGELALAAGGRLEPVVATLGGAVLLGGRVVDVERRTTDGFVRGSAVVEGLDTDRGRVLRLEIQNEHLVALEDGQVLASVPDIIATLDANSGEPVSTERLRYGQRVRVLAFPCDPVWRTEAGIALAGPRAFGYEFDYVPVQELVGAARPGAGR